MFPAGPPGLGRRPGRPHARPARAPPTFHRSARDWAPNGLIAYSKVCTHAGCPVGLYEAEHRAAAVPVSPVGLRRARRCASPCSGRRRARCRSCRSRSTTRASSSRRATSPSRSARLLEPPVSRPPAPAGPSLTGRAFGIARRGLWRAGVRSSIRRARKPHRIADVWWLMFGLAAAVYVVVAGCILYARHAWSTRRRAVVATCSDNWFIWIGGVIVPIAHPRWSLAVVTVDTTSALRKPSPGERAHRRRRGAVVVARCATRTTASSPPTRSTSRVGAPVELHLASDNVIHSFWVPQLRGQDRRDPRPAQPPARSPPTRPARTAGQCAEFCGIQHAKMAFVVRRRDAGRLRTLARRQPTRPREPATEQRLDERASWRSSREPCAGCHTVDGTGAAGHGRPRPHRRRLRADRSARAPSTNTPAEHGALDPRRRRRSSRARGCRPFQST